MFKKLCNIFRKKDVSDFDYVLYLKEFRNKLTDMVENTEDLEPLYNKDFIISFDNLSVNIAFGATEFYGIMEVLNRIIKEQE